MTIKRLLAIAFIVACTAAAWFLLGLTLNFRSSTTTSHLTPEVVKNWGPELQTQPPELFYYPPESGTVRHTVQPEKSDIQVKLTYEPKNKGLLWYRTYFVDFEAHYTVKNASTTTQRMYAVFKFPAAEARYDHFSMVFGDRAVEDEPVDGEVHVTLQLEPGAEAPLTITYRSSGLNSWSYAFGQVERVKDLHLALTTNFRDIDVPADAESPTSRQPDGLHFAWDYSNVIGAHAIAVGMPAVPDPGYVAGRMTFFAPVSLLFFFTVLVMISIRERVNLHPMNYFFLAAGCFAFQLLFAYLVDLVPLLLSFLIAAGVSMLLVTGYLVLLAGPRIARISAVAQFLYMVLFSYSFFFDGLTGLTIAIGAIVTLALLMVFTARINWDEALTSGGLPAPAKS